MSERGREVVNCMGEVVANAQVSEGWREMVNWLIEFIAQREMDERRW